MSTYYHLHVEGGRHVACMTTSGLDHVRIPTAAFGKPRDAIRYADMRQANVQPLRSDVEPSEFPSLSEVSTAQPSGSQAASPDVLTR